MVNPACRATEPLGERSHIPTEGDGAGNTDLIAGAMELESTPQPGGKSVLLTLIAALCLVSDDGVH